MNKPNYPCTFFRIPAESSCGLEMSKLLRAMEEVENAASMQAMKLGAEQYEPNTRTGAGGIGMLFFASEPNPDQYDTVDCITDEETGQALYAAVPNEKTDEGKAILDELVHLPIVPAASVLLAIGLRVLRTKKGVKMPAFQLTTDEEGNRWYYLSTFGAEFLPGRQEELYSQGMERVSPHSYEKQLPADLQKKIRKARGQKPAPKKKRRSKSN